MADVVGKPRRRAPTLFVGIAIGLALLTGYLLAPAEAALTAGMHDSPDQMAQVWNERLQVAFPAGTPMTTLQDQLQAAKFTVDDEKHSATRIRSDLFKGCKAFLLVQWDVDGASAENVRGNVLTC